MGDQNVICIIGMHRSGTSMVARLLNRCGLELGPPEQLLGAMESNPRGHFEHLQFIELNQKLLAHLGWDWDYLPAPAPGWENDPALAPLRRKARQLIDRFADRPLWGWKDPRTTVVIPFWKQLLPGLKFVICLRNPLEVARSLQKRNGIDIAAGAYLWQQYLQAAVRDTEGADRVFTFYEDFFLNPEAEIRRLCDYFQLPGAGDDSVLSATIERGLKHHTCGIPQLLQEEAIPPAVRLLYPGLRALAIEAGQQPLPLRERETYLSQQIGSLFRLLACFEAQTPEGNGASHTAVEAHYQSKLTQTTAQVAALEKTVQALRSDIGVLEQELLKQQQALQQKDASLEAQLRDMEELEQELRKQQQALQQKDALLETDRQALADVTRQLQQICASRGWQIARLGQRIFDRALPLDSERRKIFETFLDMPAFLANPARRQNFRAHVQQYGWRPTLRQALNNSRPLPQPAIDIIPAVHDRNAAAEAPLLEQDITVSVIIPAKNAGDEFRFLLAMLKNQQGFRKVEIVVVDSGSTDGTVAIAEAFGARIVHLPPEEFTHSHARNLGAENASGDYLLFTVQDALPPSERWLYELFYALKENGAVAASCAEFPREDADLFYRVLGWHHYNFMEVAGQDRILCRPAQENHLSLRKNAQISDIACLISRDIFQQYRFRVDYAEDLDLGLRLIRDGHKMVLLGSVRIIHSHNRNPYYHLRRGYVDKYFISQILSDLPKAAAEPTLLIPDILHSFQALNRIILRELAQIKLPCSVGELSAGISRHLRQAAKSDGIASGDADTNGYLDPHFQSFIKQLENHPAAANSGNGTSKHSMMLDAMQNFTAIIFSYLGNAYEQIDETTLEEFKACLYKAVAFIYGSHLADCYLEAGEDVREMIRPIHEELMANV